LKFQAANASIRTLLDRAGMYYLILKALFVQQAPAEPLAEAANQQPIRLLYHRT
jgi:hypothetical protein